MQTDVPILTIATVGGVCGHVLLSDEATLHLHSKATSWTLETYIKPSSVTGTKTLLECRNASGAEGEGWALSLVGAAPTFTVYKVATSTTYTSTEVVDASGWHHIAVTFNASGNAFKIYVDGVLGADTTKAPESASTLHAVYQFNNVAEDAPYTGEFGYMRLWNAVRTPTALSYNQGWILTADCPDWGDMAAQWWMSPRSRFVCDLIDWTGWTVWEDANGYYSGSIGGGAWPTWCVDPHGENDGVEYKYSNDNDLDGYFHGPHGCFEWAAQDPSPVLMYRVIGSGYRVIPIVFENACPGVTTLNPELLLDHTGANITDTGFELDDEEWPSSPNISGCKCWVTAQPSQFWWLGSGQTNPSLHSDHSFSAQYSPVIQVLVNNLCVASGTPFDIGLAVWSGPLDGGGRPTGVGEWTQGHYELTLPEWWVPTRSIALSTWLNGTVQGDYTVTGGTAYFSNAWGPADYAGFFSNVLLDVTQGPSRSLLGVEPMKAKRNNPSGQTVQIELWDKADPLSRYTSASGTLTLYNMADNGTWSSATSSNSISHRGNGNYTLMLTQAETNHLAVIVVAPNDTNTFGASIPIHFVAHDENDAYDKADDTYTYLTVDLIAYLDSGVLIRHAVGANEQDVVCQLAGGTKIPGAYVWAKSGGVVVASSHLPTDGSGAVTLWHGLANGASVSVYAYAPGYTFTNPATKLISDSTAWTLTGTLATSGDYTRGDLLDLLRIMLNDVDEGNYTDTELNALINLAMRETMMLTESQIVDEEHAVEIGRSDYPMDAIFRPIYVSLGGTPLDRCNFGDFCLRHPGWESDANDTPTLYIPRDGRTLKLYPTPKATGTLHVSGPAIPASLDSDSTTVDCLPRGFNISLLLERAKIEAQASRLPITNEPGVYKAFLEAWKDWSIRVVASTRGRVNAD